MQTWNLVHTIDETITEYGFLVFFSKKLSSGPLDSENLHITGISAYLFDCLVFFFRKSDPKYKILEKLQWIVDFHIYPWLPSFLFCVPIYHTTNRYISLFSFSETHCLNWFHQIHVVRTLIVFKSTWRRRNGFSKNCCVLCTNSGLTPDKMKKTAETWNLVHTLPDTISKNRVFGFIFKKWSNWPQA